jgi:hypothetical protein
MKKRAAELVFENSPGRVSQPRLARKPRSRTWGARLRADQRQRAGAPALHDQRQRTGMSALHDRFGLLNFQDGPPRTAEAVTGCL